MAKSESEEAGAVDNRSRRERGRKKKRFKYLGYKYR